MTKTMWIAFFCLVGLAPTIAIKVVTRPASPAIDAASELAKTDQTRTELALVPNEAAKSDRLPLHDIPAEAEIMPAAEPSGTPPVETTGIPDRRWQDANARALPDESLPRTGTDDESTPNAEAKPPLRFNRNGSGSRVTPSERPHRHAIARRPIESAGNSPPQPREAWHCRQDAMGGMLRSLDLSPRCHM